MKLSWIGPAEPGFDKRTFRCAACGYEDFLTVKIESAPSPSQGVEAKSDP